MCAMEIERPSYLEQLISRMDNGLVKVITGLRRCGKSYLVFDIFYRYLLEQGVPRERIITFAFDTDEDIDRLEGFLPDEPTRIYDRSRRIYLVNSRKFRAYIDTLIDEENRYYLLLDEIQLLDNFPGTLNGYMRRKNLDIYVTGSNSRMLSSDIVTTFRGRGDQIQVYPLSIGEFMSAKDLDFDRAYDEYSYYGGMPIVVSMSDERQKVSYLSNLFSEIYIKDIVERNGIVDQDSFERLIDILASSIGSYTSPTNIENTFRSRSGIPYGHVAIKRHIDCLKDSFLVSEAKRFDVRGRRYIDARSKYYFTDIGLRNVRLNFRELEPQPIMENIIYNELIYRGYAVDVASVPVSEKNAGGNYVKKQLEVDFIASRGGDRYYIQGAYSLPDRDKLLQETRPLTSIGDSFRKILVVKESFHRYRLDNGILVMSLRDFLMNPDSLNM